MRQELYKHYRYRVLGSLFVPILFLIAFGITYLFLTQMVDKPHPLREAQTISFFVAFGITFVYTGFSVIWQTQENIAVCRECGFRQKTDLVFISNIFIPQFPIKVKEEEEHQNEGN